MTTAVMTPVFPPMPGDSRVIAVTVGVAISIVRRSCVPAVSLCTVRVALVSMAAIAVAAVRVALVSMAAIAVAAPIVGIICKGWDSKKDESRREDYS